ncbi:MAG TPA: sigma-70 family RNA polymerase sigma factor [Candidatus Methylomirabilis sp.]|nr:sigma-70 family RNA polymerase sigma factor [Candidatus Methylomirabilis sp.]
MIFKRVQAGDCEAFADLVERYQRRAFAVALRLLGSRPDAEDAVQQAFLRLYENRAAYNSHWRLNTWFYRILTNACIDEIRRARPTRPLDGLELPSADTPDRALAQCEHRRLLHTALASVPAEARIVLTLYYGEGRTYQEIGAIRGVSANTVKTHLRRGRAALRKAMRARGVEES